MKRGIALLCIIAPFIIGIPAKAGTVCVNTPLGTACQPVSGVTINLTIQQGALLVSGGVDSGPQVGQTGILYSPTLAGGFVRVDANNMQIARFNIIEVEPAAVSILFSVCVLSGCSGPIGVQYIITQNKLRIWTGAGCVGAVLIPPSVGC